MTTSDLRPPHVRAASRGRVGLASLASASLVGLFLVGAPASATDYSVTTTADTGAGSLRAAIDLANANPGPDVITIPPGLYTRTLAGSDEEANATGDLDIEGDLTIVGTAGAAATTIDAAGLDRVFDVHSGTVTIQGLTITGGAPGAGHTGGGINQRPNASLHVLDSVVTDNHAYYGGGIYGENAVTEVVRTEVVGNQAQAMPGNGSVGGGIAKLASGESSIVVVESLVADNIAVDGSGGGIYSSGYGTIVNSTISHNTAYTAGGVMFERTSANGGFTASLTFVTIAGNRNAVAQGPGGIGLTVNNVVNSTVDLQLHGVLLHDNADAGGGKSCLALSTATITSTGNNLADDATCTGLTQAGDLNDDHLTTLDPLGPNGGPTRTHALGFASSAIDAGGVCGAATPVDQRGVGRPLGAGCDIGAFESGAIPVGTTSTTSTSSTSTSTSTSTTMPTTTTSKPSTLPTTTTTTMPTTTTSTTMPTTTTSTTMPTTTTSTTMPTSTTSTTMPTSTTSTTSTTMPTSTTSTTMPTTTTSTTMPTTTTSTTMPTTTTSTTMPTTATSTTMPETTTTSTTAAVFEPTDPADPTDEVDGSFLAEEGAASGATVLSAATPATGSLPVTGVESERLALLALLLLSLGGLLLAGARRSGASAPSSGSPRS